MRAIGIAIFNALASSLGLGIAAPSANRFGAVSPTSADDVFEELGDYLGINDYIIDGGFCEVGLESTILDCTNSSPTILRPGLISSNDITNTLSLESMITSESYSLKYSGNFKNHYSPKAMVVIDSDAIFGDGFLALDSVETPIGSMRLASPKNSFEFARVLYKSFRLADKLKIQRVNVILPSSGSIIQAIEDRVTKAASLSEK